MSTIIGIWISVDDATIVEMRSGQQPRVSRLVRGGHAAPSAGNTDEGPDAFYFRALDAVHHAHRLVILGWDCALEGFRRRLERYAFMTKRIAGVQRQEDSSPRSIALALGELIGQPCRVPAQGWARSRRCSRARRREARGTAGEGVRRALLAEGRGFNHGEP